MTIKTGKIGTAIVGSDHVGWVSTYLKFRITIKNDNLLALIVQT